MFFRRKRSKIWVGYTKFPGPVWQAGLILDSRNLKRTHKLTTAIMGTLTELWFCWTSKTIGVFELLHMVPIEHLLHIRVKMLKY